MARILPTDASEKATGNNFVIWMKRFSKRHYPREVNTLHD